MPKAAKKLDCLIPSQAVEFGFMSKKDAAVRIIAGVHHVHASSLGERDPLLKQTKTAVQKAKVPTYAWEKGKSGLIHPVRSSAERHILLDEIRSSQAGTIQRSQREKFELVFEELVSNA